MTTLQLHITAGPQAGARLQLNQPPVSFGRSAENALVLDLPVVSRQHGELALDEDGEWVLINHSHNTTRVGRKKATKKPVPLTDGAAITIGDTEVFRVYLTQAAAEQAPAPDQAPAEQQPSNKDRAPGAGLRGRSKLWIGLGAWFGLCILAMIFLATLDNGEDDGGANNAGFFVPGSGIDDMVGPEAGKTEIKRLLDDPLPANDPNEQRYNNHLTDARAAANAGTRSLYDAYHHYQRAISYANNRNDPLQSLDQLKFENVMNQLAEIIYDRYIEAYRRYNAGDFRTARNILDNLRQNYYRGDHRTNDPLANHIRELRSAAHERTGG